MRVKCVNIPKVFIKIQLVLKVFIIITIISECVKHTEFMIFFLLYPIAGEILVS